MTRFTIDLEDKEFWITRLQTAKKHSEQAGGIFYHWELAGPNGAWFLFLLEKPATKSELRSAERILRNNQDVVRAQYLELYKFCTPNELPTTH